MESFGNGGNVCDNLQGNRAEELTLDVCQSDASTAENRIEINKLLDDRVSAPGNKSKDCEDSGKDLDDNVRESLPITSLPEVALVKIMEYLSLKDRYHLTLTSRVFFDLFSHPNLWKVAYIIISSYGPQSKWRQKAVMHQTMKEIVKRFCHLFQHLSLEVFGGVQPFDKSCQQLLDDLSAEGRLESLSLKLGSLPSDELISRRSFARNYKDLPMVVGLIDSATRLKQLSIISWPHHPGVGDDSNDIFQALLLNRKIKGLRSLSLFYVDVKSQQWTERIPKLPSPETVLEVVTHFSSLSHLALRSPMISDELLTELAAKNRIKLDLLQILIMYSKDSNFYPGCKIPELSPQAWSSLVALSPNLKVEFLILTRIPHEQLNLMLQPDIPVSSLSILDYGKCDGELITAVAEKYKKTLEKFVSTCDSTDCDEHLIKLVNSCSQLRHLVYHGDISYKTVMTIAEIIKSKRQEIDCFEVKEKNIKTSDETQDLLDDDGDPLAVARDEEKQEYYLVGLRNWHQDAKERKVKLDMMAEQVSHSLGYRWKPLVSESAI